MFCPRPPIFSIVCFCLPFFFLLGYVYLLFESEKSVKSLLVNCTHDFSNGGDWYYKISSRRMRCKEVQVIPWVLSDSNFVRTSSQRLDSSRTVFVGGLHGMINAGNLSFTLSILRPLNVLPHRKMFLIFAYR